MVAFLLSALLAIPADRARSGWAPEWSRSHQRLISNRSRSCPGPAGLANGRFFIKRLISDPNRSGPGRLSSQMIAFSLDALLAIAAEPAPGRLGARMVVFLLKLY